jgi:hypothetical protein
MTNHHIVAFILCIMILHALPTASLGTEKESAPDYPGILRELYTSLRDTRDFGIVNRNAATIRKYVNDVVENIFTDDGDDERIEDLCRFYLFLHSHNQMGAEEWHLLDTMYENRHFWGMRYPLAYLKTRSPFYDPDGAADIDRLRKKRWTESLCRMSPSVDPELIRRQVEKWDFVPGKTAEYLTARGEDRNREIAEDMFVVICCSGARLPTRCAFGVLGYWPYLTQLRSLAECWVRMTVERGGRNDADLLDNLDRYYMGLGESFDEVLSIYRALPSIFRPHQVLMTTALASGDGANVDRAVREIKATPELGPFVKRWLSYFAGAGIQEGPGDWATFARFGPFMNQAQCDEVATAIISRLRRRDVSSVERAAGINCYCALNYRRSVDEDEIIEMAKLKLPYIWSDYLIPYLLARRLAVNVVGLMPLYAVVDFRDEDPGGPFKVYGISRVREAMKLRKPSEYGTFDQMSSEIFMMLRVLFLLLIKAEEG